MPPYGLLPENWIGWQRASIKIGQVVGALFGAQTGMVGANADRLRYRAIGVWGYGADGKALPAFAGRTMSKTQKPLKIVKKSLSEKGGGL